MNPKLWGELPWDLIERIAHFAKLARYDAKRFTEVMGPDGLAKKSPVDELLESIDL